MNAEYLSFREIEPFSVDMQIRDLDLYYGLRNETETYRTYHRVDEESI